MRSMLYLGGVWGDGPPQEIFEIKCPESGFGGISATKCNLYIQPLKTKLAIAIYNTVANNNYGFGR